MHKDDFARMFRNHTTFPERAMWEKLRKRQLDGCRFRRQAAIGKYVVDFVCFERRLVIEVDGAFHQQQQQKDDQRTAWLASQGYRVLRYWNGQVMTDLDSVVEGIWNALRAAPPQSRPVRARKPRRPE